MKSLKDVFYWEKTSTNDNNTENFQNYTESIQQKKEEPEWIWVNGYKATDINGCCMNNFKYEVGKTYSMNEEDIELCKKGFHFCKNLKDVFIYYPIARVFKVEGLVHNTKTNSDKDEIHFFVDGWDSKLVAKEIKIIEEIPFDDYKKYIPVPFVDTKEIYFGEFSDFYNSDDSVDTKKYYKWCQYKTICLLKENGMSEILANILINDFYTKNYETYLKLVNYYKGLKEDNVSNDIIVYLIIKFIEDKRLSKTY